jgi:hypothetical protein
MTTEEEEALLIEAAASAHRPRDRRDGTIRPHPAWRDLDPGGRRRAFDVAAELRAMEAALDSEGISTTGRAVLARILRSGG